MANELVLFVCDSGAAKSLIAAQHFNRIAETRGVLARAQAAGLEPDREVPRHIVAGLAADGFEVKDYVPHLLTNELVESAIRLVSFDCDVTPRAPRQRVEMWSGIPPTTDGYERTREAIVTKVEGMFGRRAG
jgi:arsenate reductase (thioredoxin)